MIVWPLVYLPPPITLPYSSPSMFTLTSQSPLLANIPVPSPLMITSPFSAMLTSASFPFFPFLPLLSPSPIHKVIIDEVTSKNEREKITAFFFKVVNIFSY